MSASANTAAIKHMLDKSWALSPDGDLEENLGARKGKNLQIKNRI